MNLLVRQGRTGLADIEEADLCNAGGKVGPDHERRRLQRQCTLADQAYRSPELSKPATAWRYPLHFIDFETSRIAVPYDAGMQPYEQVAFQWSCHRVSAPGAEPKDFEWIEVQDAYPNFRFAQGLRDCVGDAGTVLTWSHHERAALNDIHAQLVRYGQVSPGLSEWLTRVANEDASSELAMVDLCKVARRCYFHPQMKGRLSIKCVLLAVWQSDPQLRLHPTFARFHRRDASGRLLDPYGLILPIQKLFINKLFISANPPTSLKEKAPRCELIGFSESPEVAARIRTRCPLRSFQFARFSFRLVPDG